MPVILTDEQSEIVLRGSAMRILTLTQPWATLVAIGAKQYETRSWGTDYRGMIAIHAAQRMTREGDLLTITDAAEDLGYCNCNELPKGKIVAIASLLAVNPTEQVLQSGILSRRELEYGNFSTGRFAWKLLLIGVFKEAIPYRGSLGLSKLPNDFSARLLRECVQPTTKETKCP